MTLYNNQVCFRVLSQTTKSWYIQYPGFSSLRSDETEFKTPFFLVGKGEIIQTKGNGINIGDHILFAGFANTESEIYATSCNSVVKIAHNNSAVPEDLGITTQMLYAITMLNPQAGMIIYIDPEVSQKELLNYFLFKIGCNTSSDEKAVPIFDGAIVASHSSAPIKLIDKGRTINLGRTQANTNCCYLGQDFSIPFYMVDGGIIPDHFMHSTTKKNLETAYRLLYETAGTEPKTDCFCIDISDNCFAAVLKKDFDHHITPGIMSVSVRTNDASKAKEIATGIAKYILDSEITDVIHHRSEKNEVITLKFVNGSVADCIAIESPHASIDAEIHFDKTSLVFSDGIYQRFMGKSSEKAIQLSYPTEADMEKIIALGKD